MTERQIRELIEKYFLELNPFSGYITKGYCGDTDAFVKFAQEIRKQTIDEILTSLKEVPNPDANRTAINRIMSI